MTKPPDPPPEKVFEDFESLFGEFFGAGGKASGRGADLRMPLRLTREEARDGVVRRVEVPRRSPCPMCRGEGGQPGATKTPCGACQGHGRVATSQGAFRIATACAACQGRGGTWSRACGVCDGRGSAERATTLKVTVPAGVEPGQLLRLQGQGHMAPAPIDGAPDPPCGHLYLEIEIEGAPRPPAGRPLPGVHALDRAPATPRADPRTVALAVIGLTIAVAYWLLSR